MNRKRAWGRRAGLLVVLLAVCSGVGSTGCLALVDFKQKCDSYNKCDDGMRCDLAAGTCEPPIPCSTNAECGNYVCDSSTHTCFSDCDVIANNLNDRNPRCNPNVKCSYQDLCE